MSKKKINRMMDIVLGVLSLLVIISTFGAGRKYAYAGYFISETGSHLAEYKFHIIISLILTTFLIAHIVLHWKWISAVIVFSQKKLPKRLAIDRVIDINLCITFMLCTISGLIVFIVGKADISYLLFPLKGLLMVHRISAINMVVVSLVHILHHVKLKKSTKRFDIATVNFVVNKQKMQDCQ